MGGGTTVFEALRFGCNVIGNDLQPLSLFVTKALIEPIDEGAVNRAVKELEKRLAIELEITIKQFALIVEKKPMGCMHFMLKSNNIIQM